MQESFKESLVIIQTVPACWKSKWYRNIYIKAGKYKEKPCSSSLLSI